MAKDYGKWQVVRSLDEGGQSRIFLVKESSTNLASETPLRALKRFINPARIDRFKRETDVLKNLDHPSIVPILDFNVSGAKPFYVMPYYQRGNARKAGIAGCSFEEKFTFFADVLSAMAAAHSAGIVHRDLKPENILVADNGSPVIADFGICHVEDGKRFTLTEEAVGPRNYTAPELESGRQTEVNSRSDVYSLGKILYWLFAGQDLPREYHRREAHELSKHLDEPKMELVSELLDRTVTEEPSKRLEDAKAVQNIWRELVVKFKKSINFPSPKAPQRCIYCGIGKYIAPGSAHPDGSSEPHTLQIIGGVTSYNGSPIRVLVCDNW